MITSFSLHSLITHGLSACLQEVLAGSAGPTEDGSDAARLALTLQSLPKAQQRALSQLAIFPSVFDEEGAAQVGAGSVESYSMCTWLAAVACGWRCLFFVCRCPMLMLLFLLPWSTISADCNLLTYWLADRLTG